MPKLFAVMGNPIAHSLSPIIHQAFAQQVGITIQYDKILAQTETFVSQVTNFFHQGGHGLNITAPFKEQAFQLAHHHTPHCLQAGSANTLWMKAGEIYADNTDGKGLLVDLNKYIVLKNLSILIIGAGGAVRGILRSLLDAKPARLMIINRNKDKVVALQKVFPEIEIGDLANTAFDLIIHATSGQLSEEFLPLFIRQSKPICYDLNYDWQKPTAFVQLARDHGCIAYDGLGMLIAQAYESFNVWDL